MAATLVVILAVGFGPAGIWFVARGCRLRRWHREGRCFTCGYEVGHPTSQAKNQ